MILRRDQSAHTDGQRTFHDRLATLKITSLDRDGFRRGYDAGCRSTGGYNTRSYGDNGSYRSDPYNRNNNPYYRNDPYYGNNPSIRNDPYYGRGSRGTDYPRGGYGRHGGRVRIVIPFRRH